MDYSEAAQELTKLRELMLFDPDYGNCLEYDNLNDENKRLHDACGVAAAVLEQRARMKTVVVVKHFGDNGHYLFSVPEGRELKEGDAVMVRNKKGDTTAKCVCDSFAVSEGVLKALSAKYGAVLPLAPVIGVMKPEWW